MAKKPYVWDGSNWVELSIGMPQLAYSSASPNSPFIGQIWIDTSSSVSALNPLEFLSLASASSIYLTQDSAASAYLRTSASSNYLFAATASVTYLRQDTASALYAPISASTNAQTGTSYTLVLSDAGKIVEMNNASANLIIIPLNSTIAFPIGTKIDVIQSGTGATSASIVSGVTLNSDTNKRTINAQWAAASLVKRATNTWIMIGALKS